VSLYNGVCLCVWAEVLIGVYVCELYYGVCCAGFDLIVTFFDVLGTCDVFIQSFKPYSKSSIVRTFYHAEPSHKSAPKPIPKTPVKVTFVSSVAKYKSSHATNTNEPATNAYLSDKYDRRAAIRRTLGVDISTVPLRFRRDGMYVYY